METRVQRRAVRDVLLCATSLITLGRGCSAVAGQKLLTQPAIVVGVVVEIHGQRDAFRWKRKGRPRRVALLAPVYAGDEFSVNESGAKLVLLVNNNREEVTVVDHTYVARVDADVPDPSKRLYEFLASLVRVRDDDQARQAVQAGPVRGLEGLRIPLLEPTACHVSAGVRRLHLVWIGGEPPFRVALVRRLADRLEVIGEVQEVTERKVDLDVTLDPGPYSIDVTHVDAFGRLHGVRGSFDVVSDAPSATEPSATGLSAEDRRFLGAATLAATDNGTWSLEAYQRLVELGKTYPAALALAERLASENYPRRWASRDGRL